MRVRCAIIPSDMLHISTNCRTAEKMALTLLDYLFHREVQAVSNLSGQGKHGKKQLDPLTIYGIRCKCRLRPVRGGLRWGRALGNPHCQGWAGAALSQSWSGAGVPCVWEKGGPTGRTGSCAESSGLELVRSGCPIHIH